MKSFSANWESEPPGPGELRRSANATALGLSRSPITVELKNSIAETILEGLRAQAAIGGVAQVDAEDGSERSYKWLLETSVHAAVGLQALGLGPGDVVMVVADHCHNLYPAYLGAILAGTTVAPISPQTSPEQLRGPLEKCRPCMVIHDAVTEAAVRRAVDNVTNSRGGAGTVPLAGPQPRLLQLSASEGRSSFGELLDRGRSACPETFKATPVPDRARHLVLLLETSGSTGMPKFTMISDQSLTNTCLGIPWHYRYTFVQSREGQRNGYITVTKLVTSPLAWITHASGVVASSLPMYHEGSIVTVRRLFLRMPNPESILQTTHKHRVEYISTASPLLALMAQSALLSSAQPPDLTSLRVIIVGGSPMAPLHLDLAIQKLGCRPAMTFGSTEVGFISSSFEDTASYRRGSSGVLLPGVGLRVVDPETEKVVTSPRTNGEIRIRSVSVMNGYWNDEEATRDAFDAEGWFKTGDVGHWDEDGYIYIVDRIKDIFKYRSEQVSPSEIEAVLVRHPCVKEAVVVGRVTNSIDGALPTALIVPTDKASVSATELETLVAETLSDAKKLRGGIVFVDSFPRLPNGKLDRKSITRSIIEQ